MLKRINYYWRLLATGFSFFIFGFGGLLLRIFVFPVISLLTPDKKERKRISQQCVSISFYFFMEMMRRLGILTYEINGLEKLNQPGQLILANHPTLIDIVFLISRIPQANCIVKDALLHNICTRGPIVNAGYISNADPENMINQCEDCLKSGEVMIIFPEATRTKPGKPYKFHRGAAAIALQADCKVTPVTLSCTPSTLTKAEKWYQIPEKRFHLCMTVGDNIRLDDFQREQHRTIAVRRFTKRLQDYFTQQRELSTDYGK